MTQSLSQKLTEFAHLRGDEIPKGDLVPNTFAYGWITAMTIAALEAKHVDKELEILRNFKNQITAMFESRNQTEYNFYSGVLASADKELKGLEAK